MLLYVTGAPRSGKTYYCVNYIYQHYNDKTTQIIEGKPKSVYKYNKILTNIGGFKHNLIDRCEPLKVDILDDILRNLYDLFKKNKDKNDLDDILIDYLKEVGYYKVLLVFDEAHNYFDKRLVHLVFFLSYHGHLGFDILLITQSLSLIDSKYKAFAEYFIKALPTTMRIFSNKFRYVLFTTASMSNSTKFGSETLKFSPEVFNLYKSGDKVSTKSMFRNVIIFVVLVGTYALYSLFSFDSSDLGGVDKSDMNKSSKFKDKNVTSVKSARHSYNTLNTSNDEGFIYFSFRCVKDSCSGLNYVNIPSSLFIHSLKILSLVPVKKYRDDMSILFYFYDLPSKLEVFKEFAELPIKDENILNNKGDL